MADLQLLVVVVVVGGQAGSCIDLFPPLPRHWLGLGARWVFGLLLTTLALPPPPGPLGKKPNVCDECRATPDPQDSIVCQTPLNNLGFSRKGSARTFCVTFQALRAGLFEVSVRTCCTKTSMD